MGYLTTAALLPNLLFSLHAGAWVDKRGRRRQTMIAADLARAALLATIPIAYAFDALTFAQLYVVGFLVGAAERAVQRLVRHAVRLARPARALRRGELAPRTAAARRRSSAGRASAGCSCRLCRRRSRSSSTRSRSSARRFSLARISPVEPPTEPSRARPSDRGAPVRARLADRPPCAARDDDDQLLQLRLLRPVHPATRSAYLHVSPGVLGLVLGAGAVGGVLGVGPDRPASSRRDRRRAGVRRSAASLFPAPLLLVPLAGGPRWVVLACLFLAEFGSGFGVMLLDIAVGSISAALIPDRLRSRVSGAYIVVNYGVRPIGALVGGLLGSAIGVRADALDRRDRRASPASSGCCPRRCRACASCPKPTSDLFGACASVSV